MSIIVPIKSTNQQHISLFQALMLPRILRVRNCEQSKQINNYIYPFDYYEFMNNKVLIKQFKPNDCSSKIKQIIIINYKINVRCAHHSVIYLFRFYTYFVSIGPKTDPNIVVRFQRVFQRRYQINTFFQYFFCVTLIHTVVVAAKVFTPTEYYGPVIFRRNNVSVAIVVVKFVYPRRLDLQHHCCNIVFYIVLSDHIRSVRI